jgi:hypothetical protein
MTDKIQPKDEALEALDFIVNVLKEHEKDLDRLINELGTITEQMDDPAEVTSKIETINSKIDNLQKEITKMIAQAQNIEPQKPAPQTIQQQTANVPAPAPAQVPIGPQLSIKCSNWQDFQNIASKSQMLSFSFKETERVFEVNAVKGNQFITFCGELPKLSALLKCWLSMELSVPEKSMLEGILSLSQ